MLSSYQYFDDDVIVEEGFCVLVDDDDR